MDDNTIIDGMILQRSIRDFPNRRIPAGTEHVQTVCTRLFFPPPPQEPGNEATTMPDSRRYCEGGETSEEGTAMRHANTCHEGGKNSSHL